MIAYSSRRGIESARKRVVPWFVFVVLSILLFFAEYGSIFEIQDPTERTVDFIAAAQGSGNHSRQLAYIMLCLFGVWTLMRRGWYRLCLNGFLSVSILILCYWCLLSLAWSIDPLTTGKRLAVFAFLSIGVLATVQRFRVAQIIYFIVFSSGLYLSIAIVVEVVHGIFAPLSPEYRFAGTITPNEQAHVCSFLVLSALAASRIAPTQKRLFQLVVLYGFVFLLMTKARNPLAALAVGVAVYWHLTLTVQQKSRIIFAFVTLGLCGLLCMGDLFVERATDVVLLGRNSEQAGSLTGRVPLWDQCLTYVAKHPILGYGYESFWTRTHIEEISTGQNWGIGAAHSAYIELMLTLGLVGLALHSLMMLLALGRSLHLYQHEQDPGYAFMAGLIVYWMSTGLLESLIITKPSPVTFQAMLVIATLAFTESNASLPQ